jgi:hypothetical protein
MQEPENCRLLIEDWRAGPLHVIPVQAGIQGDDTGPPFSRG